MSARWSPRRQKDIVEGYIASAERSGARLAAQGTIVPDAPAGGAYVTPTLIRDVPPSHRLAQEEIFGPVQVDHALRRRAAGDRSGERYALWPCLLESGRATAGGNSAWRARIQSGQVFINNYGAGGGIELPFGGVKRSGHGREKGFEALYGFATTKTISIYHG